MDEHTVTGVFKQYLRDLPNPLMTFERFEIFAGIAMRTSFAFLSPFPLE